MAKLIYEVTIAFDGTCSVSLRSDDPLALQDALPVAKRLQQELAGVPDTRAEVISPPGQTALPAVDLHPQAPRCEIHQTPMSQVQGKHGPFWSCHQRNLDGTWCTYRPARAGSSSPTSSFSPAA